MKLLAGALLLAVAVAVVQSLPDIARYFELRDM